MDIPDQLNELGYTIVSGLRRTLITLTAYGEAVTTDAQNKTHLIKLVDGTVSVIPSDVPAHKFGMVQGVIIKLDTPAQLTPKEFKAMYKSKGWASLELAARWRLTREHMSRITNNPERGLSWDDSVRGLEAKPARRTPRTRKKPGSE